MNFCSIQKNGSAMYIKGSINSIIPELLCCLTGVCMVNKKSKGVKV
jgi:hypothetical protein